MPTNHPGACSAHPHWFSPSSISVQPRCNCGGIGGYWQHTLGAIKVCQPTSDSRKTSKETQAFFIALPLLHPGKLVGVRILAIPSRFLEKDEQHSTDQHWLKILLTQVEGDLLTGAQVRWVYEKELLMQFWRIRQIHEGFLPCLKSPWPPDDYQISSLSLGQ